MEFDPHPAPSDAPRSARWVVALLGTVALALYAIFLARHVGAVAAGSDSSGYMNGARLMASGRTHLEPRTLNGLPAVGDDAWLYSPLGFKPAPNGDGIVPTYPAGLSLLVLLYVPLFGWAHAGDAAIVSHAVLGVAACYVLGRLLGLRRLWSGLGAVLVALSPITIFMSLQAMSDIPSLAWTVIAVAAALKSRERGAWAVLSGAALSLDVLLRPTNAFAVLPVAVTLGLSPRRLSLLVLGGLPGACFLLAHNSHAYGSLLTTGYGDYSYEFGRQYIPETLRHYLKWLPNLFTPAVLAAGALPFVGSIPARTRWMLGLWIISVLGFYATYSCTHQTWWYLRFLLPAAPALVIGALLVLQCLAGPPFLPKGPAWTFVAPALLLGLAVPYLHRHTAALPVLGTGNSEARYKRAADWVRGNLPADSICLSMQASGALLYYTDLTLLRWDKIDSGNVARVDAALKRSGRPVYAVLFPFDLDSSRMPGGALPGRWTEVGRSEDIAVFRREAPGNDRRP